MVLGTMDFPMGGGGRGGGGVGRDGGKRIHSKHSFATPKPKENRTHYHS
jgi:hypothetical protein